MARGESDLMKEVMEMKKFLALLLSAMLVLSLAACGAKDDTPAEDTNNPASGEETAPLRAKSAASLPYWKPLRVWRAAGRNKLGTFSGLFPSYPA